MTITLDDELSQKLMEEAHRQGQETEPFAASLLRQSLNVAPPAPQTLHSIMEFAGVGAGRPGALKEDAQTYIERLRAEWDEREETWRP